MTSSEATNWAREEAERISDQFGDYEWGYQPSGAKDLRLRLTAAIESALLAVERKAKEECADICSSLDALECSQYNHTHLSIHDIRSDAFADAERAIRSTLPPTSKAE